LVAGLRRAGKTTLARAYPDARFLFYWRDKQKHEVDFVVKPGRAARVIAIECTATAGALDPAGLAAFRRRHPTGDNWLVCLDAPEASVRRVGGVEVDVVPYAELGARLDALA
jgi:hypothetical protein